MMKRQTAGALAAYFGFLIAGGVAAWLILDPIRRDNESMAFSDFYFPLMHNALIMGLLVGIASGIAVALLLKRRQFLPVFVWALIIAGLALGLDWARTEYSGWLMELGMKPSRWDVLWTSIYHASSISQQMTYSWLLPQLVAQLVTVAIWQSASRHRGAKHGWAWKTTMTLYVLSGIVLLVDWSLWKRTGLTCKSYTDDVAMLNFAVGAAIALCITVVSRKPLLRHCSYVAGALLLIGIANGCVGGWLWALAAGLLASALPCQLFLLLSPSADGAELITDS